MNSLDGAFIGGLLGGILEFGGNFIDKNNSDTVAHRKDLGASAHAKAARSAGIINRNFHNGLPYISQIKFSSFLYRV
jgi:hypothetical protein